MSTAADAVQPGEALPQVWSELQGARDSVVREMEWFRTHAVRPRILFQVAGTVTVLLSVTLPLLSTLTGLWQSLVLPIASLGVAALTSLNAFFQWQVQWRTNRETQFALEYLLAKWDLDMIQARSSPGPERTALAFAATSRLLDQAREVTSSSTSEFFKGVRLPTPH